MERPTLGSDIGKQTVSHRVLLSPGDTLVSEGQTTFCTSLVELWKGSDMGLWIEIHISLFSVPSSLLMLSKQYPKSLLGQERALVSTNSQGAATKRRVDLHFRISGRFPKTLLDRRTYGEDNLRN